MEKIKIATNLTLPSNAVTQKLGFIGVSGSGKTYGASKLAELFWSINAQFVVLDPVGVWYGMRLAQDGKSAGIPIPVFGGLHGDIPLEPTSGFLIADLIVDRGISAVIDVSQFESDSAKARFSSDFAERLFFRKKAAPSAIHVFLEECQEFVPQNPMKGEEMMLHRFHRLQKLGRNFGIGTSLITQRPQETSKKALNQAQNLFVFRLTGSQERKAIESWIEDKGLDQNLVAALPKIETGHAHFWSPAWMKMSEMVHILPKRTFDASATPEVGIKSVVRHLAPVDIERIKVDMAATIEKAEAENPAALKRKIAELQRHKCPVVTQNPTKVERIEVPTVGKKAIADVLRFEASLRKMIREIKTHYASAEANATTFEKAIDKLMAEIQKINHPLLKAEANPIGRIMDFPVHISQRPVMRVSTATVPAMLKELQDGGMTGPELRILNALAWCESIKIWTAPNELLAFLSGYSNYRSTGYTNPRGYLKAKGLIDYGTDGVQLKEAGRALAEAPTTPLTTEALHQAVLTKLDGPERKLLAPLLAAYPGELSNEDLCAAGGYTNVRSTGYTNPRGRLRSFGLIEYNSTGVRARSILFL